MARSILLVDDNEAWTILMKTMLENFGSGDIEILYAADGEEGVEKYEKMAEEGKKPDLVLMDIQLPNMKGNDATKAIIKKHTDANIFAFTMFPDKTHRELMENAGVKGFISKLPRARQLASDIIGALEHGG